MHPKKCDIIVPVRDDPDWVKQCVRLAVQSTPDAWRGTIFLVDDASDAHTASRLDALAARHSGVTVCRQETPGGFARSVNLGMARSTSPCVLVLHDDCLLAAQAIPRLAAHVDGNGIPDVGLVFPVASRGVGVNVAMRPGLSFLDMDALLERSCAGLSFDVSVPSSACFLVTRECFDRTGRLDESLMSADVAVADYVRRARAKGFSARTAADAYVYHEATSLCGDVAPDAPRGGGAESKAARTVADEIEVRCDRAAGGPPSYDVLFYLPGISQGVGGVHVVVKLINELIVSGVRAGLVTDDDVYGYAERMFFSFTILPSVEAFLDSSIEAKAIVATASQTVFPAYLFAVQHMIPLVYYVQGYEPLFANGEDYGAVEETYAMADCRVVTSDWLGEKLRTTLSLDSTVLPIWYEEDVFTPAPERPNRDGTLGVTCVLRGHVAKGDWLLIDIIKQLSCMKGEPIRLSVIHIQESVAFGRTDGVPLRLYRGPLPQRELRRILRETDIFVDASLYEGFGLFPLEAMACGAVPVVSDSGGVRQYIEDGVNGVLVREVNQPERYVAAILELVRKPELLERLRREGHSIQAYASEPSLQRYVDFFRNLDCPVTARGDRYRMRHLIRYFGDELRAARQETEALRSTRTWRLVQRLDRLPGVRALLRLVGAVTDPFLRR